MNFTVTHIYYIGWIHISRNKLDYIHKIVVILCHVYCQLFDWLTLCPIFKSTSLFSGRFFPRIRILYITVGVGSKIIEKLSVSIRSLMAKLEVDFQKYSGLLLFIFYRNAELVDSNLERKVLLPSTLFSHGKKIFIFKNIYG